MRGNKPLCSKCGRPIRRRETVMCYRCIANTQPAHPGGHRNIDADNLADEMWSPPHMPPVCPRCRGSAWVCSPRGRNRCPECRLHPGRTCTQFHWTELRLLEVPLSD